MQYARILVMGASAEALGFVLILSKSLVHPINKTPKTAITDNFIIFVFISSIIWG
jgi:hypothetical protein